MREHKKRRLLWGGACLAMVLAIAGGALSYGGDSGVAGAVSKASKAKPVFIGVEATLSGAGALPQFGNGEVAYLRYANSKHLVPHTKFVWKLETTANTGAQTLTVTKALIAKGAVAIESFASVPADALVAEHTRLKVPMVVSSTGALFTANDNMFTATPPYPSMWHYALQLVRTRFKKKSASIVYTNDAFGLPLQTAASTWAKVEGVKVVTSVPVPSTTVSGFTVFAARLQKAAAPIAICGCAPSILAGMIAASNTLGYDPIWLTNWGAEIKSVTTAAGPAASRLYALDFLSPIATTKSPAIAAYESAMRKYYPKTVDVSFAQTGWDQSALLVAAIKALVVKHKSITPAHIVAALGRVHGNVGTMSGIRYTKSNHYGIVKLILLDYKNGKWYKTIPFTKIPPP